MKKKNKKKSNNVKRIDKFIGVAIILIVMAIIYRAGYARYRNTHNGKVSAQVAKMICEMEVIANEGNLINPCCTVIVKNYKWETDIAEAEIAETDITYKIQVIQKDDSESIGYYWKDSDGIEIEGNEPAGSFEKGVKSDEKYTIVFLNSGEENIEKQVEFKLVAEQAVLQKP